MPRINATKAEHAARRAQARRASNDWKAHYAQPGVWQAERKALDDALALADARGDAQAIRRTRNAISVLNLYKPQEG